MSERFGIAVDYRAAIADEIRETERKLGRGDAKTFAEYAARCAEISALKKSLKAFESILEKYLEEEELENV